MGVIVEGEAGTMYHTHGTKLHSQIFITSGTRQPVY